MTPSSMFLSLTRTFGVGTLAGRVQVVAQVLWEVTHEVRKVPGFNGPSCQLEQGWGFIGHVLDKAHYQRVTAETELL